MNVLGMTRDAFAHRFGLTRRALDTYLLPDASAELRHLPEVARRYICEVVWLYNVRALTYTHSVHIMDFPLAEPAQSMNTLIDPLLVRFEGVRLRREERTAVQLVVDGVPRPLPFHLAVRNHSPMGFEWGYNGSGPSQLALAMCVELVGPIQAVQVYQHVRDTVLPPAKTDKWSILGYEVIEAIEEAESALGEASQ